MIQNKPALYISFTKKTFYIENKVHSIEFPVPLVCVGVGEKETLHEKNIKHSLSSKLTLKSQ